MAAQVRVRSLAKVNLDLRVLNKRPDGFHELRTVFQTISLSDTIDIEYRRGSTRIDIESNLNIEDNIIAKTADSVLRAAGRTGRVGFVLTKRIPLGGGMGGGSSNAAAVLMALPALLGKRLPVPQLMELASNLGSDVPFFLMGGTAVGLGRGTELYPLPDRPNQPSLLITPGIHCSTPEAYRDLGRKSTHEIPHAMLTDFQMVAWQLSGAHSNDFEEVVFRRHPQLESIKGKLLKFGARPALMSGSGSTMFGVFESRIARDRAAGLFRKDFAADQVLLVTTVNRRSYRALWRKQLAEFPGSNLWQPQDRYAQ